MEEEKKLSIRHRSREEVLAGLQADPESWEKLQSIDPEYLEELILYAMGEQGLRITYDVMFHEIMDPARYPERMESLLSAVLGREVQIIEVLEREGIRLSEKASFVVADFIVKDQKGEYLNLEIQKMGYAFPLHRSDCYTADLVMRQYDRLKREKGKNFCFSQLSKAVTVVLMEQSYGPFLKDHCHAVHHRYSVFDTKLPAEGLTENYYISLDIYRKYLHTGIRSKRDAWMSFLSSVTLQSIVELCGAYPEFIPIYEHIFSFREDVKGMVDFYTEALQIMNRNTELYMVEEMREEIEEMREEAEKVREEVEKAHEEAEKAQEEAEKAQEEAEKAQEEAEKAQEELRTQTEKLQVKLEVKDKELEDSAKKLKAKDEALEAKEKEIEMLRKQLEEKGRG